MLRFITLDPGHFHAALVQKEMYPDVSPVVHVYAPPGPDLSAHLQRIAAFNLRPQQPTTWQLDVHAGDDFLQRFLNERPGDVAILAGRNARKIDYLEAAVGAGLHVLADKPWILRPEDLPRLAKVLAEADRRGLIAYDIMTERYEITSILQRALVQDAAIFGEPLPGTPDEPRVVMESVHYLKKTVAGMPLRRPAWFFDVQEQGEGLSDVGTHLVDQVAWMLSPHQAPDPVKEIEILSARRWPTPVSRDDFRAVTGEAEFPERLRASLVEDSLPYYCNTQVAYAVRGIHVKLDVLWGLEASPGAGDSHLAIFHGSRSRVEIRQGAEEKYRPELYVIPRSPAERLGDALAARVEAWQSEFPGVTLAERDGLFHIDIPDRYRVGHEAHFAEVTRQFLAYVKGMQPFPAWENGAMVGKYRVSTWGVAMARGG